ncbi:MAG: HK97 family phage prohead protease [Planctomycetota bacterium]
MTSATHPAPVATSRGSLDWYQIPDGVRGVNQDRRSVDAVMSTPALDRYGERVEPSAYRKRMGSFLAAPRLLFNHDHDKPIGRWEDVRLSEDGLIGTAIFDSSPEGELRFNQIVEGTLNSFSVAWLTHAWVMRDEQDEDGHTRKVRVFTDVELLECSLVTIPANPEALIRAASFGGYRSTTVDHPNASADHSPVLALLERIDRRPDAIQSDRPDHPTYPNHLDGSAAGVGLLDLRGTGRGGGHAPDWHADAYFADDATHTPPEVEGPARAGALPEPAVSGGEPLGPSGGGASGGDEEALRAWLSDELGVSAN